MSNEFGKSWGYKLSISFFFFFLTQARTHMIMSTPKKEAQGPIIMEK